jgi:hypothetical protein
MVFDTHATGHASAYADTSAAPKGKTPAQQLAREAKPLVNTTANAKMSIARPRAADTRQQSRQWYLFSPRFQDQSSPILAKNSTPQTTPYFKQRAETTSPMTANNLPMQTIVDHWQIWCNTATICRLTFAKALFLWCGEWFRWLQKFPQRISRG